MRPWQTLAWPKKRRRFDKVFSLSEPAYAGRPIGGEREEKEGKKPLFSGRDQVCHGLRTPTVTFATSCWEKDWKKILLDPEHLPVRQIGRHRFNFSDKLLILNNISEIAPAREAAERAVQNGVLTRWVEAPLEGEKTLAAFGLERGDFAPSEEHPGVSSDWLYYNALAPLSALHHCQTDYLLYTTGDVFLEKPVSWIPKALKVLERNPKVKVANLTWNRRYGEARRESFKEGLFFYYALHGFSDQMFLVRTADFRQPIYREIRSDSHHFPRGDVFEKRVFSYMKNRGWQRITYRWGSYFHDA